ncbi:hypothetical protein [Barnesiella viscericola]|uniref:hypothetical protein n=1 Tax=Barnesiella viscericola TaxID=397865 RepID=UPI002357641E|nr:hypothetical protein [Barnesiella viscericola]
MGKTTDSFKREIGKNAGKAVSNWLFGDAHSTPYRRVDSAKGARRETQRSIAEAKIEAYNDRLHRNQMYALDAVVLKNIDSVANIHIPDNKEDLVTLLSELSVQVEANRWHGSGTDEAKIRNKFCDALLSKYKQCVQKLQFIDNTEPQLFYFESILKKAKRDRLWKCYSGWSILLISFILIPLLAGVLAMGLIRELIFFILVIWLFFFTLKTIRYRRLKKLRTPKPIRKNETDTTSEVKQAQNNSMETASHTVTMEPKRQSVSDDISTTIDLNDYDRIEQRLNFIWNKYRHRVDDRILERRPIFSAEGEQESILFVGINPSYTPDDDNTMITSKKGTALLYNSLYKRPGAPLYFKELEKIADRVGYPYTHINLLYARENNREALLNTNSDFIREQLELTYDTIRRLSPVAIVFFSEYCYQLIFGKNRWIDPHSETHGHYILRGTSIPVFFSEDIMDMNYQSRERLIRAIRQAI